MTAASSSADTSTQSSATADCCMMQGMAIFMSALQRVPSAQRSAALKTKSS
nr:MAG TPA: hypothetical protein [Bacteriophage sp.]